MTAADQLADELSADTARLLVSPAFTIRFAPLLSELPEAVSKLHVPAPTNHSARAFSTGACTVMGAEIHLFSELQSGG